MSRSGMSVRDIAQWIDNDEGLYNWWKRSRQPKARFIRENRRDVERVIRDVLTGAKPAHHLAYGR